MSRHCLLFLLALAAACSGSPEKTSDAALPAGLDGSVAGLDAAHTDFDAGPSDAAQAIAPDAGAATLGMISVADLNTILGNGTKDFLLINVHHPYQGDIAGTDQDILYTDTNALSAYIGADLDRKVVVYCMSNYMSGIAGNALVARGYRAIRYLDGGMGAWKSAGYTLEMNDGGIH